MAITLRLPTSGALGQVGFAYSPALEATLSLRAVLDPKRYPMYLPWSRRARDLPADLRAEIDALSFAFRDILPGIFEVGLTGDFPTFEEELERIAACADDRVLYELTLPFGGYACGDPNQDPGLVHDPDFQHTILDAAREADPPAAHVLEDAFVDPAGIRARLARMLEWYWDVAFHEEWASIHPRLEAEVGDMARALVSGGLGTLVEQFMPEATYDPEAHALVVDKPYDREVDVAARGGLAFVPVAYDYKIALELDPPWHLSVFVPLRSMRQPEVPQANDREVAAGLRALGDETRLQIMRFVSESPRSTRELAQLLSLSESAVSRHLKMLATVGVVDSERDGYYVLYRLQPDRIGALGGALRRTLGMAPTTTGKAPPRQVVAPRDDRVH